MDWERLWLKIEVDKRLGYGVCSEHEVFVSRIAVRRRMRYEMLALLERAWLMVEKGWCGISQRYYTFYLMSKALFVSCACLDSLRLRRERC